MVLGSSSLAHSRGRRWCSDNSRVPVLLLPPLVLASNQGQGGAPGPSNALLVAAAGDPATLPAAFDFAARTLSKPSDAIYVIHAIESADEEAAVAARKHLLRLAADWQSRCGVAHAPSLNIAVDVLPGATAVGEDGSSVIGGIAGASCEVARAGRPDLHASPPPLAPCK